MAAATPTPARRAGAVGTPGLTDDEVGAIQQVIVDTGALADLEATIDRLTAEAVAALDGSSSPATPRPN